MEYNKIIMAEPVMNVKAILIHLQQLIDQLEKMAELDYMDNNYASYLHGQIYGIAITLRLLYPGPGNWGEKAALLIRPVLTEHQCECLEKSNN